MACAQCSFYAAKESSRAQALEAKANLLRLRPEIPLSEPELAAVEQGLVADERLIERLADAPTPDRLYEIQSAPVLQANNGDSER